MAKGKDKKKGGKKDAKQELDFKDIAGEIANAADKQHVTQLGPSLTKDFLDHARYTKGGVEYFKSEFNRKDGEKAADVLYDSFTFHLHRRFLKIDEAGFKALQKIKDPNGTPYMDVFTEYHLGISRDKWKEKVAPKDENNKIDVMKIQEYISPHVKRHGQLIGQGIIDKNHLTKGENMGRLKGAIDDIVKEYKEDPKEFDTSKMYTPDDVLGAYLGLAEKHYTKGAHPEPKKPSK